MLIVLSVILLSLILMIYDLKNAPKVDDDEKLSEDQPLIPQGSKTVEIAPIEMEQVGDLPEKRAGTFSDNLNE